MHRKALAAFAGLLATAWCCQGAAASGHIKVLTYNIAGLPDGFMTAHPSVNMPLIGSLLSRYDLALVQEDFAYGALLRRTIALPYQSEPFVRSGQWNFGDGLSQFSSLPFSSLRREPWTACHGVVDSYFDCLTPKGFSVTQQSLAPGVALDVYNVHLDAGGSPADQAAREAQIEQLITAVAQRSAGKAVLLAGDTNIRGQRALLSRLEQATGLRDVCSALHCPDRGRIDRVFLRGSPLLSLTPRRWSVDSRFVDANRQPLSDHLAVAVEVEWTTSPASS